MDPKPYIIGIDPGVNTGVAVYDTVNKHLIEVITVPIHEAFTIISAYEPLLKLVRIEDARQRKWFGENVGKEKLQGAGSIKRDCKIWEDFLKDSNIPFELIAPKQIKTKVSETYFKALTKWKTRTSNHARDAAMLVFGF